MPKKGGNQEVDTEKTAANSGKVCGIVMPISELDGCSEEHWADVLEILQSAIETAGFTPNLVSNANEVGVIQKRIIQNLYNNPVVVCDVSGKNPNVMFELGVRLAFDKPTIIVKDDKTSYSFDTGNIEHLEYPRDLRYAEIVGFKETLADKISSTYEKATSDPAYTTFLKNFGEFTVAKLDTKEIDKEEFILEELKSLRQLILARPQGSNRLTGRPLGNPALSNSLCLRETSDEAVRNIVADLLPKFELGGATIRARGNGHFHVHFPVDVSLDLAKDLVRAAVDIVPGARWFGPDGQAVVTPRMVRNRAPLAPPKSS
jgi:hypothetical protein